MSQWATCNVCGQKGISVNKSSNKMRAHPPAKVKAMTASMRIDEIAEKLHDINADISVKAVVEEVAELLARLEAAKVTGFNKAQPLPKGAEFLTTMRDRDVYAFEEWFYFVDPTTNKVVEITLQKHVPFLQKHLKKGFLAKLGLAASVVEAGTWVRVLLPLAFDRTRELRAQSDFSGPG
jgi:hypothetical protein